MKYRCIKDIAGSGCLEVGRVYNVESEEKWGHTNYTVDLGEGKTKLFLSEETISYYLVKVEES